MQRLEVEVMYSVVVPVYRNESSVADLLNSLEELNRDLDGLLEAVLVVDGSPDRCAELLAEKLPRAGFDSQLLCLSRNYGSFAAIRAGLASARGTFVAVMSADLQEPPELVLEIYTKLLSGEFDVVVGRRVGREDPPLERLASAIFWSLYRKFVQPQVPKGGVDIFGCTSGFRDHLLRLVERNSTLVGLVFWLGFRRGEVEYSRRVRTSGRSGWSLTRRIRYLLDSTFAFSDLPIRFLSGAGVLGLFASLVLGLVVLVARVTGQISVPGYAATILAVMFFGGLNALGIGILGEYVWRAFENTKGRPEFVVANHQIHSRTSFSDALSQDGVDTSENRGGTL